MVRKRKDQPVQVPTGRPYGARQELEQAQQAVPVPAMPGPPTQAPPAVAPSGQERLAAALMAAQQMGSIGGALTGPTRRPYEPVTAGLVAGPGPGPEALGPSASVGSAMRALADETGDADLEYLAELVGRLGL